MLKSKLMNLLVTGAYLVSLSAFAAEVKLSGALTSGGLIIAEFDDAVAVRLNDEDLMLTETKQAVFGFGRDQHGKQRLSWHDSNGQQHEYVFTIAPRDYVIDRVDGVPQQTVTPDPEQQARARREAELVWQARDAAVTQLTEFLTPIIMPAKGRISGVYGSQRIFNGTPRNPHYGLDIAAPKGSPVIAPWSGRVILAEPDLFYSGGTLIVDHGHGVTSTFIHLDKIHVAVGDFITQGQRIADIGATGRVTGPHLDWRINWRHLRLDPALVVEHFSAAATNPVPPQAH